MSCKRGDTNAAASAPPGLDPHLTEANLPAALRFVRIGETTVQNLRAHMARFPNVDLEQFDNWMFPAGNDPTAWPIPRVTPPGMGTQVKTTTRMHIGGHADGVDDEISEVLFDFRLVPGRAEPVLVRVHAFGWRGANTLCDHAAPLANSPLRRCPHDLGWTFGPSPGGGYTTCVGDEDRA
ncbi:MAG: hypothetical protein WCJ30_27125, partial [Deltaproteobacteria bacterium]